MARLVRPQARYLVLHDGEGGEGCPEESSTNEEEKERAAGDGSRETKEGSVTEFHSEVAEASKGHEVHDSPCVEAEEEGPHWLNSVLNEISRGP